ncbi:hypothetical protein CQJ94_11375 [Glycomyces fuscus]|nr:hypothetical protein CQJ94_11375 [Glycomyces fuscus]
MCEPEGMPPSAMRTRFPPRAHHSIKRPTAWGGYEVRLGEVRGVGTPHLVTGHHRGHRHRCGMTGPGRTDLAAPDP